MSKVAVGDRVKITYSHYDEWDTLHGLTGKVFTVLEVSDDGRIVVDVGSEKYPMVYFDNSYYIPFKETIEERVQSLENKLEALLSTLRRV